MLTSYDISRKLSKSNPIEELRREKKIQLQELYNFAADREEILFLSDGVNNREFKMSPRIMDAKFTDSVYPRIKVETICEEDVFVAGDYIYDEKNDKYWLCLNSELFHGMYCRGLFQQCNYILKWQNRTTLKIIERPAIVVSATKYGVGQDFGEQLEIPTQSRQIQVRYDEETVLLDSPIRLFLDRNTINPKPYKITSNDNTTINYGNGIIHIVCQRSEYNDKTDSIEHFICDYIDPNNDNNISGNYKGYIVGRDDLRVNDKKNYHAKIYQGNELMDTSFNDYSWNVVCDFKEFIDIDYKDNDITLMVLNEKCIGKSFFLQLLISGRVNTEMEISVVDMY